MTNLLAMDTATDACSLALWLKGEIIQQHSLSPREHVRVALPMLQALLLEAGISLSQLDALVLGVGPGSFTGLRVAAGLMQGLAFGLNIPVVSISTLRTLAQGFWREEGIKKTWVTMDAGMGQIYSGEYALGVNGLMQAVTEDRLYKSKDEQIVLYGEDAEKTRLILHSVQSKRYPQAKHLVELGYASFLSGHFTSSEQAQPLYLRDWSGRGR